MREMRLLANKMHFLLPYALLVLHVLAWPASSYAKVIADIETASYERLNAIRYANNYRLDLANLLEKYDAHSDATRRHWEESKSVREAIMDGMARKQWTPKDLHPIRNTAIAVASAGAIGAAFVAVGESQLGGN